jgi:AraC-like DNA-binding protein
MPRDTATGVADAGRRYGSPTPWTLFRENLQNLDLTRLSGGGLSFHGHIEDRRLGSLRIRLVGSRGAAMRGERSRARIEGFQESLFWIGVVLDGSMIVRQNGSDAQLGADDFTMLDPTQPYCLDIPAEPIETLWLGLPRRLVAGRFVDVEAGLAVNFNDLDGPGAMTSRMLQAALRAPVAAAPEDADRIAAALLDLLATAANARLERDSTSVYQQKIVRRIKRYIDENLSDASLSVGAIARENGLSARYLAKLFQGEADTVSAWIWRRRLEICRQRLLNAHSGDSVSQISYAQGFKSVSHFSRAFQRRYGLTPSQALAIGRAGLA